MGMLFYLFAIITIVSTINVILNTYPVYALLYLIVSILSTSCIFFILGAYFAGALEIIIYAGAIVVLFIFVVMLLNIDVSLLGGNTSLVVEYNFRKLLLLFVFLIVFLYFIWNRNNDYINNNVIHHEVITLKDVGISLFGPYIFLVEMSSIFLLGALIISLLIGRVNNNNSK